MMYFNFKNISICFDIRMSADIDVKSTSLRSDETNTKCTKPHTYTAYRLPKMTNKYDECSMHF